MDRCGVVFSSRAEPFIRKKSAGLSLCWKGSGISFLGLGCVVLLLNVVRVERWEQNGEQIDKGEDKVGAS